MPMEVLYDQPYLTTTTPDPVGFPQTIDVVIGGRSYIVNTSFEPYRRDAFRHRSIQAQRESIDLNNIPGEGTINSEGLWRRTADDWHFGAGQPYQDRKGSVDSRFSTSKGINPWMQWQATLLNDTVNIFPLTGDAQVMRFGSVLYILDLDTGKTWVLNGVNQSVAYDSSGNANMMATDGYDVWWSEIANQGIWTQAGLGGSVTQYVTSGTFSGVWWVADRLMATAGAYVYNIIAGGAPPSALLQNPTPNWIWTDMCATQSFIYMSGYNPAGPTHSAVYRTTIEPTGTALEVPVIALPLEDGEYVTALYAYLNFVFVGTNLGVRMCRTLSQYDPSGNAGDLEAGPLIPGLFPPGPVGQPVQAMVGNNRFLYFGWSDYDSVSTGIGRMDISTFIDTQAPAFTSDLMATGSGLVTSMTWNPVTGTPLFAVDGLGVFADAGYPVPEGTLVSGQIGYGISDDKILWAGDIGTVSPQKGTVAMSVSVDNGASALVGTQYPYTSPVQSAFPIGQYRGEQFTTTMTLTRDDDGQSSPILHRATLKALPAITAGTHISVVLLLMKTVSSRGGDLYYNAYAEYQYFYNLRTTQTVVKYEEGPFTAMCVIDELDWLPFKESDADPQGGFIGDLIVYLKTVDVGA